MRRLWVLLLVLLATPSGHTQEAPENEAAKKKLKVAPGMEVSLWAANPQLVNPVAISIDEKGRIYVAEAHRRHTSTLDIHMRKEWLDDDLACRRHEDQVAYHLKRMGDKAKEWMVESERIRILEDRSGTGRADSAVTFSEGYHGLCEGIGAGILVRGGEVWYTCIPNLWYLKDTDGDGQADVKKALFTGFGVHLGASGHDMHGLRFGPDGKLYWSHGDRGFHVESEGKVFDFPDGGGVFRANPDGSDLELVCTGLRNPQELQFDAYGNLFTGDNNISIAPDVGETCRWTYIVEGADFGWRIGYQFMAKGGAWCEEEQWKCEAGFQVPFVARLGHGPSGVAYHPGVAAIPARYKNHFFMCDYPGGIWSFEMKPKGASFEMVDLGKFLWDLQAPDVEFGPDGAVYVADWVGMWDKAEKGRIWKLADPELQKAQDVREVRTLIEQGMKERKSEELETLLAHADQRVRQAAQFELVARNAPVSLLKMSRDSRPQLARLHAIWGLGQLGQKEALLPLLVDKDDEVRAQAAKTLGGLKTVLAYDGLLALLRDASPRVQFMAAMGLGKIGKRDALPQILQFLRDNPQDRMLQHAGIMALTWIEDVEAILRAGEDATPAVRMAALVALRKLKRPEVARLLKDADPKIVLEAARAIYDTPLSEAFPKLAELLMEERKFHERVLLRAVNAAFRLGRADLLGQTAAQAQMPAAVRVEALQILGEWPQPSGRDRLMGLWRPIPARPKEEAVKELKDRIIGLMSEGPTEVAAEAARLAGVHKIEGLSAKVREWFRDLKNSAEIRAAALRTLAELKDPELTADVARGLDDEQEPVAREAIRLVPLAKIANVSARLEKIAAGEGSLGLRQMAIYSLAGLGADLPLKGLFEKGVPPGLQLDLLEAASRRPALKPLVSDYEAARKADDPLSAWRETLEGGDPAAGRKIFFERGDVQCVRCHTIGTEGGQVGPPLSKIGGEKTREYLLESIVTPNKQIAEGWGQTALQLQNDSVEVGRIEKETDAELTLVLADGQRKVLAKAQVKARKPALSSMPEDLVKNLSKRELRDLVAFLATLK